MNEIIKLPYGKTEIRLELPEGSFRKLVSRVGELKSSRDGAEIVREAMRHPFGGRTLKELAVGKRTATVIISDHTRPVPSKDIIPAMLEEIRSGNPDIDITLLVATGCHRGTTAAELEEKLGKEIATSEKIVVHDCIGSGNVGIGTLPSGAKLVIDRVAAETDLLVSEGFIEPHFFAGFSGGGKSVLPGVCARKTVLGNHCSAFIDSPYARTGIIDKNPIQTDIFDAAKQAKLAYIVNVIIDENKKTVAAFAGDLAAAHKAGREFLSEYCTVKAEPADIVVTTNGGAPMDQNIYQCVKGMTAAEATAKEGAVIILCAAIDDGTGGDTFYKPVKECGSPEALYREVQGIAQDDTKPDQWEYQILCRLLMKHKVIFVTEKKNQGIIEDMKMTYAPDVNAALKMARELKGEGASLTVIPDGIAVAVKGF
jgi:nickel-dependent lactate racemase